MLPSRRSRIATCLFRVKADRFIFRSGDRITVEPVPPKPGDYVIIQTEAFSEIGLIKGRSIEMADGTAMIGLMCFIRGVITSIVPLFIVFFDYLDWLD